MSHTHTHDEERTYYIDQVCTIGVCALLGGVCVVLWLRGALGLLADPFHMAVLLGGVALLVVAAVRGVTLWSSVSRSGAHGHTHVHAHDHDHDESCGHEHHHHEHEHHHHEHSHAHAGHDHGHEHGHGGNDHGHSHGWNPIRYVFLLVPIVLFLVRMPSQAFNERFRNFLTQYEAGKLGNEDLQLRLIGKTIDTLGLQINKETADDPLQVVRVVKDGAAEAAGLKANDVITTITLDTDDEGKPLSKPAVLHARELTLDEAAKRLRGKPKTKVRLTLIGEAGESPREAELTRQVVVQTLGFKELERAAFNPAARQAYEGMTVSLKGQFVPRNLKAFSLIRVKITCCAADAIPLNVIIMLDANSPDTVHDLQPMTWVEVTGQVTFHKRPDREEYVPVLYVASRAEGIRPTDPEPFLQ